MNVTYKLSHFPFKKTSNLTSLLCQYFAVIDDKWHPRIVVQSINELIKASIASLLSLPLI